MLLVLHFLNFKTFEQNHDMLINYGKKRIKSLFITIAFRNDLVCAEMFFNDLFS